MGIIYRDKDILRKVLISTLVIILFTATVYAPSAYFASGGRVAPTGENISLTKSTTMNLTGNKTKTENFIVGKMFPVTQKLSVPKNYQLPISHKIKAIHPPAVPNRTLLEQEKKRITHTHVNTTTPFIPPPSNLTGNSLNRTTLKSNKVGIRELGTYLLNLNVSNSVARPIENSTLAANPKDPLFINTVAAFDGFDESVGGSIPPDVQLASGPNHLIEILNVVIGIFTKQGSVVPNIANPISLNCFFQINCSSNASLDHDLFDPKIIFDAQSGRWFASATDATTNKTLLAVSTTNDPSLSTGWNFYGFLFQYCPDQPIIGLNNDKFVISVNDVTGNDCSGSAIGSQYVIIDKNNLISGAPASFQMSNVDSNVFSVHPVHSLSSTSTLFMVSTTANSVLLYSITGSVPNAMVSVSSIPIQSTNAPPSAVQRGTTTLLDTGDTRVLDATWYLGKLWFTFGDACTPTGDTTRACFRLDELDTSANPSLLLQDFDVSANGFYYFYPALRVDTSGNLGILFGYSSSNDFPSLAAAGIAVGTTTLDNPIVFKSGSGSDTQDCANPPCPPNPVRYGDYFGAALDPADSSIIWAAAEYHTSSTNWSTFIGEMTRTNVWSGFSRLGGSIIGDPAVGRNADGRLEVFVIGTNHALYHKFQTMAGSNSWSGFASLGGNVISNPVVGQDADGRLEVFAVGTDHAVWHKFETSVSNSNSYSGFSSLGGNIIGDPAVALNTDGSLELFVVQADKRLYHNFQSAANSNTWVGYSSLGGAVILDPVVSQNSDGRLQVFVIGTNNAVFYKFQTSASSHLSYSGFFSLGGVVIKDPTVGRNTDGRLELFVIGSNNALYHNAQTSAGANSWTGFVPLGGSIIRKPAVAQNEDGRLEVFVIQTDKALYYNIQSTIGSFLSYSGFVSLGGIVVSDPVVAQNSDKRLEVFVIGADNGLWHIFQLS